MFLILILEQKASKANFVRSYQLQHPAQTADNEKGSIMKLTNKIRRKFVEKLFASFLAFSSRAMASAFKENFYKM